MKEVYEVAGVSRQALHQHLIRRSEKRQQAQEIFAKADAIRKEHPGAGCRRMALDLGLKAWGRDKIEGLLLNSGYRVFYPRRYKRTTDRRKEHYYPNRIEGLALNDINQVVQTDITYYEVRAQFFYTVFLIDVYSRRIVGYTINRSLKAKGNIKALQQMFKIRKGHCLKGLIHHSDRGSQYIDVQYRLLLEQSGITPSMCVAAWENAYTERINRTIKEEYLNHWKINDYASLKKMVRKAVHHYNNKRGHSSLNRMSPVEFENYVQNLPIDKRPNELIYKKLNTVSTK
jgi:transposase InsO family protein